MDLWPESHRQQLKTMLIHASQQKDAFAVFDADNTLWRHDIGEALLAWMDHHHLLELQSLPPPLLPLSPLPEETTYSYYLRLCQWDHAISYLWAVQALQGFDLGLLKKLVTELMSAHEPIPATIMLPEKKKVLVPIPKVFPAQAQLIEELHRHGIDVWVVSASAEEVVRMICSEPLFGLNIPPERVIGVNMVLQAPDGRRFTAAEERQAGARGMEYYHSAERLGSKLTHHLYTPATWYAGKVAAIKTWIHPARRPFLVAGDSPNDFFMQFYADVEQGGARLRITHTAQHTEELKEAQAARHSYCTDGDPYKGWIEVAPHELGVR
jgi:phosphorylcholine phosphatase